LVAWQLHGKSKEGAAPGLVEAQPIHLSHAFRRSATFRPSKENRPP
jgi:hypothetical protein